MSGFRVKYHSTERGWETAYNIFRNGKWMAGAICRDLTAAEKAAAATIERLIAQSAQQKNVTEEAT